MGFRAHGLSPKVDVDVNLTDYYLTGLTVLALNTPRTKINPAIYNIMLITSAGFELIQLTYNNRVNL